jgi:hypothetical protein
MFEVIGKSEEVISARLSLALLFYEV